MDKFESMSDEELRQYVYGNKEFLFRLMGRDTAYWIGEAGGACGRRPGRDCVKIQA